MLAHLDPHSVYNASDASNGLKVAKVVKILEWGRNELISCLFKIYLLELVLECHFPASKRTAGAHEVTQELDSQIELYFLCIMLAPKEGVAQKG